MPIALPAAVLLGLLIGSLLDIVAYRLPRGESLIVPGSERPTGEHAQRPYDDVAVLSWLARRGRRCDCREPVPGRGRVGEALTALLFAAVVAVHHDDAAQLVLGLVLVAFLVPLTLIDLHLRILPDRLTAPAAVLALGLGVALDPGGEPERLIAALAAGGFLFVAWLLKPDGMGLGDVKLAAAMGLFLGRGAGVAIVVALIAGALVGAAIMQRKGIVAGRTTTVAFGPFLSLGAVVALLAGEPLLNAYLVAF